MLDPTLPVSRDLVLVGGGHTHALVLRKWGMQQLPGVRLTLVNSGPYATYSGMLPGFVAGHYTKDALNIDLVRLARFAGARFIAEPVAGLDLASRRLVFENRPDVAFDLASIDVGITSAMPNLPGFTEHGIPAKPLHQFAERWQSYIKDSERADIVVLGAGVAGAELAMAMAHAFARISKPARITLIDKGLALNAVNPQAAQSIRRAITRLGIVLREGTDCIEVTKTSVRLSNGTEIPSTFTTGAAASHPHDWLSQTGLQLEKGFIKVDSRLRSSEPGVFAAGDCAHLTDSPRPKAGVFAVRQAPILYHNLRASLIGQNGLRPYRPQSDYLKLVSLGSKTALADKAGMRAAGAWIWRLKDRIDQDFMRKLNDLPPKPRPDLPWPRATGMREAMGDKPACGGCGSKLGAPSLRRALAPAGLDDIRDDAAVIDTGGTKQVFTTDHLRAFTEDPATMARISAIHALGDIWAMGAQPQAATINVTLPKASPELAERSLAEIMQSARAVMAEAGASLVGGHTSIGLELTIGFAITGLTDDPVTLAGAKPGDDLILTKPLGTGVVMAADMQMKAKGHWVQAALASMCTPPGMVAAHAMTDVTGFGLAGHLSNLCEASGCGAEVTLASIPLLPGALELAQSGIRSSLYPENRAAVPGLPQGARADLLFDPQTAGGLLAAVPPGSETIGTRIGRVTDNPGQICVL